MQKRCQLRKAGGSQSAPSYLAAAPQCSRVVRSVLGQMGKSPPLIGAAIELAAFRHLLCDAMDVSPTEQDLARWNADNAPSGKPCC